MYFVYKITNLINKKVYIGSSSVARGYNTRWEEHQAAARLAKNPSYNYPLQKAIRKYGIENFSYEIIVDHITSQEEREIIERQCIEKFNSLTNTGYGYNQTLETQCALCDKEIKANLIKKVSKPCCLVDKNNNIVQIFSSVHEAAKFAKCENGPSNITRICNGESHSINGLIFRWLDNENNIIVPISKTREKRKPIIGIQINNPNNKKIFSSILEASQELSVDRSSVQKCLKGESRYSHVGGYVFRYIDNDNNIIPNDIPLEKVLSKYICIDGEYRTFGDWCTYFNISKQSIYTRMKKHNITKKEALLMQRKR